MATYKQFCARTLCIVTGLGALEFAVASILMVGPWWVRVSLVPGACLFAYWSNSYRRDW